MTTCKIFTSPAVSRIALETTLVPSPHGKYQLILQVIIIGTMLMNPWLLEKAQAQQPAELLRQAIIKFSTAEFETSLVLLEQAREVTTDAKLLGRIQLYTGANYMVLNKPALAKVAFTRGLQQDPELRMDPERFNTTTLSLFQQVRLSMVATLLITGESPGAKVYVDGKLRGDIPFKGQFLIGPHVARVKDREGRVLLAEQVNLKTSLVLTIVKEPAARPAVLTPERSPSPGEKKQKRLWTYLVAGGALAAVGVGLGLGVAAGQDHTEYQDCELDPQRIADLETAIESKTLSANILFGVAGVMGATAVVLFFLEGRPAREADRGQKAVGRTAVSPLMGGAYGLSLSSSF